MGAQQSTGAGAADADAAQVKTSYYELLAVERSATDDEIKKAYRRKALELHPDRNYGDVERATALFAEVQTAYQVLSDPQERAWYDAHEGDILRGGAGEGGGEDHYEHNMRVTTADDLARMMGKFRSNVEYSDAPTGFFGFIRETFEQLAQEEQYAADWEGVDMPDYPSFGHKDDTYEGVVRDFYTMWNGFATRKSFAWKDKYRLSEAPDRRVRRLMEKENKKFREDGIREFNDAVRTLLLFIRKRDPRYTPNTQSADERAKAQRAATKERAAKAKAAQNEALMNEAIPEWATRRDPDELEEEEEEESEEEHFECVACHKTFKSERQYDAHEKSKKHQKAIQALKKKMRKDNAHLNLDEDALSSDDVIPMESEYSGDDFVQVDDVSGLDESGVDVAKELERLDMSDKATTEDEDEDDTKDAAPESNADAKQPDTAQPETKSAPSPDSDSEETSDDEYASRSDIEARLAGFAKKTSTSEPLNPDPDPISKPSTTTTSTPKLGKAAQKRAKKAAKAAEAEDPDLKHKCMGCDATFPSKTQLFQHIKDHGHAAPVSATKGAAAGGKKKGKRK